jgi:hypothetical protein
MALTSRLIYRTLPLSMDLKLRLKDYLFEYTGSTFAKTGAYIRWQEALRKQQRLYSELSQTHGLVRAFAAHDGCVPLREDPANNAKVLVFVHVPKCAGTTLRPIIISHYRPDDLILLYPNATDDVDSSKLLSSHAKCYYGHKRSSEAGHLALLPRRS